MSFFRPVLLVFACLSSLSAQDASEWAWVDYAIEGKITKMDAELAPQLREGMVFSAVYALAPEAEAGDLDEAVSRSRFLGVVDDVDVTIDLNYVLVYQAQTGLGERWVELTRAGGDIETGQDVYSILLPLAGEPIGEEGWSARWLQVWFYGEGGEWLASTDLKAPPEGYRTGWWRMTFWNTDGTRPVRAEGVIEAAGEAGEPLTPGEQIAQLEEAVIRLGNQLELETARSESLRTELAQARSRIEGLQKTVDVIIEERRILQNQYDLLKLEKAESSPELTDQLASLEADVLLWKEKELAWKEETRALAEALALAEVGYAKVSKALSETKTQLKAEAADARGTVLEPQPVEPAETVIAAGPTVGRETIAEETPPSRSAFFRRPGKFRR